MSQIEITKALAPIKASAVTKAVGGVISLGELLKVLDTPDKSSDLTPVLPHKVQPTAEQVAAVGSVLALIEKAPVPEDRRELTQDEIRALLDERAQLDEIEKLIKDRKEAMRTTVFNHLDLKNEDGLSTLALLHELKANAPDTFAKVAAESGFASGDIPEMPILQTDAKAEHYLIPGSAGVPDRGKVFRRELKTTSPVLTADGLKRVEEVGGITHDDFLALTTPVRVVDEAKVLLWLRSHAEKASLLRDAMTHGSTTAALFVRKA